MSVHITRRALVGSASAAAALWLTGCATTAAPREENIRPATFSNLGARAAPATPLTAKRIPMPVVDAFKGDGIFFFDDDEGAQFRITDLIRENNRYKVEEDYAFGKPHGFSWGSGAVGIMRDGRRVPPENPTDSAPRATTSSSNSTAGKNSSFASRWRPTTSPVRKSETSCAPEATCRPRPRSSWARSDSPQAV